MVIREDDVTETSRDHWDYTVAPLRDLFELLDGWGRDSNRNESPQQECGRGRSALANDFKLSRTAVLTTLRYGKLQKSQIGTLPSSCKPR